MCEHIYVCICIICDCVPISLSLTKDNSGERVCDMGFCPKAMGYDTGKQTFSDNIVEVKWQPTQLVPNFWGNREP